MTRPHTCLTLCLAAIAAGAGALPAQEPVPPAPPPAPVPAPRDTGRAAPVLPPAADTADSVPADTGGVPRPEKPGAEPWMRALVEPATTGEDRLRLEQLAGGAPATGFLLRSPSTLTPRAADGPYVVLLAPRVEVGWNSRLPFSVNDGPLWAGKGGWSRVLAGVEAAVGPLRIIAAPELAWTQNAAFDSLLPAAWDSTQRAAYTTPWHVGLHAADLPYRFGDEGEAKVFAGESSVTLRLGPVEAGAATESQWWGPGVRGTLLLTNQAGGFPHALLRTAAPVRTPLGLLEARWIAGRLSSSAYDTASTGRHRSLSAAAVVLTPGAGVSLGAARVVYQPMDGRSLAEDAADVFFRWRGAGDTATAQPYEQMSSLFVRWVMPSEGAEVYGELGRRRLPTPRDLLERPEDTQAFVLGFAWARPAAAGRVRLSAEATYLEQSATYRARPPLSWYAGRAVPQGYTHRGQAMGAFVGPGASGQWLAVDYLARRGQAGISVTRVRWSNDAYYDKPGGTPSVYRGHDVSLLGTLRGALALGPAWVEADWSYGPRYNFLFQNTSTSFLDIESVSPRNHTLRLKVSFIPPAPAF